jgi:sugar lactone lactonase YvrE
MLIPMSTGLIGLRAVKSWDLSTASYDSTSFSVSSQDTAPSGVSFKPDGTVMFMVGNQNDSVYEYTLSTAWDVSTASYVDAFDFSARETLPQGFFVKPDGTKMYVVGASADEVQEYDLSTAWDVSTTSYSQAFGILSQMTIARGLSFKPDGTKMYVAGQSPSSVYEYTLSTAWDVSTASFDQSTDVSSQDVAHYDVSFKPDGTVMFLLGNAGDDINEYALSTAWDISTATYVQTFSVSGQDTNPIGLFVRDDGLKMFLSGGANDTVYQYSLG